MNFSLIISNSSGTRRTFTFLDRSPTSLDQLDTLQLLIKSRTSGYHPGFHASSCLLQLGSAHLSLAVPLHLFLLQQLKPGWSLSRLAGSANLHIVPFIRRALTHNKRQLTLHLETRLGHDCTWMVREKTCLFFTPHFAYYFFLFPNPTLRPLLVGCSLLLNCWQEKERLFWASVFMILDCCEA